jgi:hypothetical protein
MARRLGDPAALGDVLARRWTVLPPTSATERWDEIAELTEVARGLGDPNLSFWAALWTAMQALVSANRQAFDAALVDGEHLAQALGQPLHHWGVGFTLSTQSRIAGDLEEAERRAELALEQAAGIPDARHLYGANLFWIRYDQGRVDEMVEPLRRGVARLHHNPLSPAALAVALCELERLDEAGTVITDLAAGAFTALPGNFLLLYGLTMAAEGCARLGDVDRCGVLYEMLAPHGGLIAQAGGGVTGSVDHYVALLADTLGRTDESDARFASAAATHERLGAPPLLARTRLEWGQMLLGRARGEDIDKARQLLHQAQATARRLGLGTIERRTSALLQ